jgi:hypothetical protein
VTFVCRSSRQESIAATPRAAAMTVWPGAIFFAVLLTASFWPDSARSTSVPAPDGATHAVVARDTMVCQSPWHVLEARECRTLSAGTEVSVVSSDEFFACVVWSGTQRCMWVARDALRRP